MKEKHPILSRYRSHAVLPLLGHLQRPELPFLPADGNTGLEVGGRLFPGTHREQGLLQFLHKVLWGQDSQGRSVDERALKKARGHTVTLKA